MTPADQLAAAAENYRATREAAKEAREQLRAAVIAARPTMSLRKIAAVVGVGFERVRQIEKGTR